MREHWGPLFNLGVVNPSVSLIESVSVFDLVSPRLAGVFERSILKSPDCFLFDNLSLQIF